MGPTPFMSSASIREIRSNNSAVDFGDDTEYRGVGNQVLHQIDRKLFLWEVTRKAVLARNIPKGLKYDLATGFSVLGLRLDE